MLSSRNSGKYLMASYEEDREACALDKDQFSAADQEYLEVDTTPHRGRGQAVEDTFLIDTCPVDPLTPAEKDAVDIRHLPQMGGDP
jgi:hypothetical protein